MKGVSIAREPWSREAVWRKLEAFSSEKTLKRTLGDQKNIKDIIFSLKTARDFLLDKDETLATRLIHNYYGCFWTLSTIILARNPELTLDEISQASKSGHGLALAYDHNSDPLNWGVFILRTGFFPLVLKSVPFETDLDSVSIKNGISKKEFAKDFEKYKASSFTLDELVARFPELNWHYELLSDKPSLCLYLYKGYNPLIRTSKLMKPEIIKIHFPKIQELSLDEGTSQDFADCDQYKVEFDRSDTSLGAENHSSPMTDKNVIAQLTKPLKGDLLRHTLFSYSWSIIARYAPNHLKAIEEGDLTHWLPFLDEYNWLLRIRLSTECLNCLTNSEWKFAPPTVFGV